MSDIARRSTDLVSMSATELLDGYAAKAFSPVEVLDAVEDRIDRLNPDLNAFYVREQELARTLARASERRWARGEPTGPIDGVPITLKETLATVGTPLPSGTAALKDAPAQTLDSPVAASTTAEGAVRLGKTVMPDYGMLSSGVSSLHGISRSPWNREWTTGGSSAGASAACAARFGPLHIGSDIGGSIRLPAGWNGLASLKPTFAIVPVDPPYIGRAVGPLCRTVGDVAVTMQVIARPDPLLRDYTFQDRRLPWSAVRDAPLQDNDIARLRIGIHTDAGWGMATEPEVARIVHDAGAIFERAGARVKPIGSIVAPEQLDMLDLFLRARSWLDIKSLDREARESVLPFIRDWVIGAADHSAVDLIAAYQGIQAMRYAAIQATKDYDVVLSPVAPVAAFPAHWPMPTNDPATSLAHIGFTAPYNFSEQPAATVNAGFTADRRPVGLQLAAHRFDDVRLLQVAQWFEAARPAGAVPVWPL